MVVPSGRPTVLINLNTMKRSNVLTVAGVSTLLAAWTGHAQSVNNFYFDTGLGAAFQQDASIHASAFGNSGNVEFDPGIRADLHFGYNITRCFAAEIESGVIWNNIKNFQTPGGDNKASTLGYSAELYEVPVLANFIYRPLHGAFQPYIGVGCGGTAGIFDSENVPLYSNANSGRFNANDWTFAYQAELGLKYAITSSIQLGLGYEFLGTTSHDWTDNGYTLKTGGTMTHAVVASFTWEF
jgi:opacity protein-like surface antigen